MPEQHSLHDAFIDELRDVYDAERQILKALPKMIKTATADPLKMALEAHLRETETQVTRLEKAFRSLGETVRGKHCDGMAGILEEGKATMEEDFDEMTMDACLIAAGQRVEHYEMAAYGTLIAWAKALGHDEAVPLLEQNLNEEKAADEKLTAVAESGVNEQAAAGELEEDEENAPSTSRTSRSTKAQRVARRR
jgi:ferritin-like metal-binding protein YciE